jgi:hypothetical protein
VASELLTLACQTLDRAETLRAQIDEDGEVQHYKGALRAHPAIRDEINCRKFIAQGLMRLGLAVEAAPIRNIGRPFKGGLGITDTEWATELEEKD